MFVSEISRVVSAPVIRTAATKCTKALQGLAQDTVSFTRELPILPRPQEESLCQKIISGLFGNEVFYMKSNPFHDIRRFTVRAPRLYVDLADGVFTYDKNFALKNITFQHHNYGSYADIGEISVFDKAGKLLSQLSPEQAKVLRHYRGNLAVNMNAALRHGNIERSLFPEDVKLMDGIFADAKIPTTLSQDTTVYRGVEITGHNANFYDTNVVKGNILTQKGFLSTSANRDVAENFGNALFAIKVPKGKKFLDMHAITCVSNFYRSEEELLFARNSRLLIKDIDYPSHTVFADML